MAMVSRAAAALDGLGRRGAVVVAAAFALGIAFPSLGAAARPYFSETVLVLMVLTFLRTDPRIMHRPIRRPAATIAAAIWIMALVPAAIGSGLAWLDIGHPFPALFLALLLHAMAPPVFALPRISARLGLGVPFSMALLLACTALAPFAVPALTAVFAPGGVAVSPSSLGVRLALMIGGSACMALAIRGVAGAPRIERHATRLDGVAVIAMSIVAVALTADVLRASLVQPALVLALLALAASLTLIQAGVTALALRPFGRDDARAAALAAGSRNIGLMLAASAGLVPDVVWLYAALAQIPLWLLPQIIAPLRRGVSTGA